MNWRTSSALILLSMLGACSSSDTVIDHDHMAEVSFTLNDLASDPGSSPSDPGSLPKEIPSTKDLASSTDTPGLQDLPPLDTTTAPDLFQAEDATPFDSGNPQDIVPPEDLTPPQDTFVPPSDPGPPPDPCEGIDCGPMGFCSGGACQCDSGYEANPSWSACVDIDECAQGLDNCASNATCSNNQGSYVCACTAGYTDVHGDGSECVIGYNACGVGRFSPKVGGTFSDPMEVPYLPMVDHNDTAASSDSNIATYDCAPSTLETGPEVVYRFVVDHPGTFHAQLNDPVGVDIDIHLVQNPVMNGSQMTGCIGRAHEELTVEDLPAGEYWVFADSWSSGSIEYSGSYTLAFEWTSENVWNEVPVDTGIVWSRLRSNDGVDTQTINKITVEVNQGWDLQAHKHNGCATITSVGDTLEALAGVNGGYFSGSCGSLDLLRADGVTYSTNTMTGYQQRTMGWNPGAVPTFQWLDTEEDWTSVSDAIGGYPSLVTDGVGFAEAIQDSQVWSATDWARNPRTITGIDNQNRLVMITVDGRTSAGEGMTTPELATYLQSIGITQAIGLDGGGSTSMMVRDCWLNHVVNYPSDNNTADHYGLRSVADGFYIR